MKRTILIILFFGFCVNLSAQKKRDKKIKAYKIAFITEQLDLTEAEAEKFWPLFNKHEKSKHKLFRQQKTEIKSKIENSGGVDSLSNKEAKNYLNLLQQIKKSHYEQKTEFYEKLLAFLPAKKVLKLEVAEHEFNKTLMRKLRRKDGMHKKGPFNGGGPRRRR